MKLKEVMKVLEKKYPLNLKEEWDNIGLLLGDSNSEIKKIMLTLDLTKEAIEYSKDNNVDLIISHHPLIFKGINKINNQTILGKKILDLIKNGINVYTLHTNIDAANGGLNDFLLEKIGIDKSRAVEENYFKMYKMIVYLAEENYGELRLKILNKNRENNFVYKESLEIYKNEDLNNKKKIEINLKKEDLNNYINFIKVKCDCKDEDYEIIEMENDYVDSGIGRIYTIEKTLITTYIKEIKKKLGLKNIRAIYNEDKEIEKIAFVNGSGASFIKKMKTKVDLFITGDVKYHEALDAKEAGLAVLDIGHYEAEVFFIELIKKDLIDVDIEIIEYRGEEIFKFL